MNNNKVYFQGNGEGSNISIVCPSPKGKEIALKLQKNLNAKLYIKESNRCFKLTASKGKDENELEVDTIKYGEDFKLNNVAKEAMETSNGVIFISSIGIAIRAIAQFIKGKDTDPGVVVVDLSAKYAINILSGHLGGGNDLTFKVAEILNLQPIVTTATDNLGIIAPDVIAKNHNLIIDDLKKAKHISVLLVDGKTVGIKDDYSEIKITNGYKKIDELKEDSIWITHDLIWNKENNKLSDYNKDLDSVFNKNNFKDNELDYSRILKLIKKDLVLGIGCRKNTPYEKLNDFIKSSLEKYNFDIRAVNKIVSVDVKKDEVGIIELAKTFNCPFETFSREEVKTVQDKYEKSEFVLKTLGITGVCEPCVDLSGAEVIISKVKHEGMTLAIGVLR